MGWNSWNAFMGSINAFHEFQPIGGVLLSIIILLF